MRRRNIEHALRRAVSELPAPDYRALAEAPVRKMEVHDAVTRQMPLSPLPRRRRMAAVAAALCLLVLIAGLTAYVQFVQIYSVVELSINPSFAIELNRQDKVRAVSPRNGDAEVFLEGRSYQNWTLEATVRAMLQELSSQDRVGDTVEVSVSSKDLDHGRQLREQVVGLVGSYLPQTPEPEPLPTPVPTPSPEPVSTPEPSPTPAAPVVPASPSPSPTSPQPGHHGGWGGGGSCRVENLLTEEQIRALILAQAPGADIKKLELDEDDGLYTYEIEYRLDDVKYEVELDACSGAVLKWEIDD